MPLARDTFTAVSCTSWMMSVTAGVPLARTVSSARWRSIWEWRSYKTAFALPLQGAICQTGTVNARLRLVGTATLEALRS